MLCGAALRTFLYNEIKINLNFKCFGLAFSPFTFILFLIVLLKKHNRHTTKKLQSSHGSCFDASWTTSGLQTTG